MWRRRLNFQIVTMQDAFNNLTDPLVEFPYLQIYILIKTIEHFQFAELIICTVFHF